MKIYCSIKACKNHTLGYFYHISSRCPLCDAPADMPKIIKTQSNCNNVFSKYLSTIADLNTLPEKYSSIAKNIGNTPIFRSSNIERFTNVHTVYLKSELENSSGSFKDRGTFTAVAGHAKKNGSDLIIGTVSTGNMAISTIDIVTKLGIPNFVVINSDIEKKKLEILKKMSGRNTNIFAVEGDYSQFHEIVYQALGELRAKGIPIFAELTDDFFRTVGYSTISAEIIDQFEYIPDNVVVCGASGALFLALIWYFEKAFEKKLIQKLPRVHLIQELGGDPIAHSYRNHKHQYMPLAKMEKGLVASAIDVTNSRSGGTVLQNINESNGRNSVIAVSSKEIIKASKLLTSLKIEAQVSSASVVAGLKKLQEANIVKADESALLILTGKKEEKRTLKESKQNPKLIHCTQNNLQTTIINTYMNN